jgi:O-antigen/teichoic acid export membrane protein
VIGKNIIWLFLSQIATWMISVVLLVIVPDRFGDENFGKISFAIAFMGFFTLIGMLGTYSFLVRTIARDHSAVGPYIFNAVLLKISLAVVLSGAALGVASAIGYSSETMTLLAIGCGVMLCSLLSDTLLAGLAGMERMGRPALWSVVQIYVAGAAGLVVVLSGGGVVAFVAVGATAAIIPVVANAILLWPHLRGHLRVDFRLWKAIVIGGVPLLALSGLNLIYGSIDIPILKSISGNDAVGWYALAYKWVGMPVFISSIVVTAFLPSLSNLAVQSAEAFSSLTNRAVRLVGFVSIPASVGIALTANELLTMIYDKKYERSIPLMQILAIHIPLAAMDTVLATALIAADRQRKYLIVAGTAAVFNPALNFVLIHLTQDVFSNGAIGAAIMTVTTEVFIMAGALHFRGQGVMDRNTVGYLARCVAAAGLMVPGVWLVRDTNIVVMAIIGGGLYVAGSFAARTIDVAEVKRMAGRIRLRGGGPPDADAGDETVERVGSADD